MNGKSPKCYIPSFIKIGPLIPEKDIFKGFYQIYGHGGHLGHLTWAIYTILIRFIQTFYKDTTYKIWL